jgi:release factor glutamine methyltransferase
MLNVDRFNANLERLISGEPVQYILGFTYFCQMKFNVDSSVLIPRPETEELVENVSLLIKKHFKKPVIGDIGTGSGAIAICLKKRFPSSRVIATDISTSALDVALENSQKLVAEVELIQGDMIEPFLNSQIRLDVLVSNPPYIESLKEASAQVVDYEPHIALFAPGGTLYYEQMLSKAHLVMKPHFLFYFEIGEHQQIALEAIIKKLKIKAEVNFIKDLQGKVRFMSLLNIE